MCYYSQVSRLKASLADSRRAYEELNRLKSIDDQFFPINQNHIYFQDCGLKKVMELSQILFIFLPGHHHQLDILTSFSTYFALHIMINAL